MMQKGRKEGVKDVKRKEGSSQECKKEGRKKGVKDVKRKEGRKESRM